MEAEVGALCLEHARAIAQSREITPEQILGSAVPEPVAWLVDQWGAPHPLTDPAVVGRTPADAVALHVLHPSVSTVHAQLERKGGKWHVLDRNSLNGTFVNGERVRGRAPLHHGDRVAFGEVTFYFSNRTVAPLPPAPGVGRTIPLRSRDARFAALLRDERGRKLELLGRPEGGIIRDGERNVELGRLEFALLEELALALLSDGDPDLAFVPSQELSQSLDFKSRDANGENVRELVSRVRRKLKRAGIDRVIESRQGAGYRLVGTLESASSAGAERD